MRFLIALALACLGSAPVFAQATLLARYRLDEAAGTTLVDEGPHNLAGTFVGRYTLYYAGAAPGTGTSVDFAELAIGRADIANHPALASITSDISYAAWFRTRSTQGYRRVFASQDGGMGVGLFYDNLLFTTRGVQDFVQPA